MENATNPMIMNDSGHDGTWLLWIILILALVGGNGFGFGGGANQITNDFLYTNLKNTVDMGFNQTANQNFQIQKDIASQTYALGQAIAGVNASLADVNYNVSSQACGINRNIDGLTAEGFKNTCAVTNAIHADGEATRALIVQGKIEDLQAKLAEKDNELQTANFQLSQMAQSANIINALRPFPQPAYLTASPYTSSNVVYGGCGCACNA